MLNKEKIFTSWAVKIFLLISNVFLIVSVSCHQDVINIGLTEIGSQIIIEGSITDGDGPYTIKITRTGSHFRQGDYPPVTEAVVRLSDNAGHSETLAQTEPGIYKIHCTQGIPGRTYTLEVSVEGEKYSASSTMPRPIALDSLSYIKTSPRIAFVSCYFTDHKDVDDYCRFKIYRNGDTLNKYWHDYILYNGKYTDGEQVVIDDFYKNRFYLNDYVRIELLTIDKAMYEYWYTLYSLIDQDFVDDVMETAFSPITIFNPTSNLSNNALGYFSAHTVRVYTVTIN